MSDWQPIETAPKDGTLIMVFPSDMPGTVAEWPRPVISAYRPRDVKGSGFGSVDSCCGYYEDLKPTHWMPMPHSPDHKNRLAAVNIIAKSIAKLKSTVWIGGRKQQ